MHNSAHSRGLAIVLFCLLSTFGWNSCAGVFDFVFGKKPAATADQEPKRNTYLEACERNLSVIPSSATLSPQQLTQIGGDLQVLADAINSDTPVVYNHRFHGRPSKPGPDLIVLKPLQLEIGADSAPALRYLNLETGNEDVTAFSVFKTGRLINMEPYDETKDIGHWNSEIHGNFTKLEPIKGQAHKISFKLCSNGSVMNFDKLGEIWIGKQRNPTTNLATVVFDFESSTLGKRSIPLRQICDLQIH